MAHILIGWELGAYSGHIRHMLGLAEAFEAAGHRISLALQRLDALPPALRGRYPMWQAPVWRRLLGSEMRGADTPIASHADILARLGIGDSGMLSALIAGWDQIIAAAAPDLIVANYAPALQRAAAGRLPVIADGTGFSLPPPEMAAFPGFGEDRPPSDERMLLATVNEELASCGRAPLPSLPGLYGADAALVCCFAEFDPYAQWRRGTLTGPQVALPIPPAPATRGEEVFVYWPQLFGSAGALWDALQQSRLRVRVHAPSLSSDETARLAAAGFATERAPVPFARIVERSALIVCHGGLGIVSSALVAGLPVVVVPVDMEKIGQANTVTRLGLGGWSAPGAIVAQRFAADLRRLAGDPDLAGRSRAAAESFRRRLDPSPAAMGLQAVERLLAV